MRSFLSFAGIVLLAASVPSGAFAQATPAPAPAPLASVAPVETAPPIAPSAAPLLPQATACGKFVSISTIVSAQTNGRINGIYSYKYPTPPKSDASDTYFGTVVPDPYRPLESIDADTTKAWIGQENALTRCVLDGVPARASIAAAYKKLENFPKTTPPFRAGNRFFYDYNTGLQTQYVIYERDTEHGPGHVFFDPNTLSKDGSTQLVNFGFTTDGKYMTYSTSSGGEDWRTWHVKDVATGRDTSDVVHWSKFSGASWDADRGFYYSAYDAPTGGNKTLAVLGVQKIYFHKRGTPQSADRLVFASTVHPERFVGVYVTHDDRYAIMSQSTNDSDQLFWKRTNAADTAFRPFTSFEKDVSYSVVGNDGSRVYLRTNNAAPRFRVVSVDLNDPAHALHEVVPQAAQKLDEISLVGNAFYLGYLQDAHSVVRIASTSGRALGSLSLPGIGSVGVPRARRQDRIAYYGFTSYAVPYETYRLDTKTMRSTLFDRPKTPFDTSAFVTEQVFATSEDGTKVPIFVTHRKDIAYDGSNPTILYGYGGFDISETPYYSTDRGLWLQMGGVYADVVLRGGGEYGEPWHDAGRLGLKQNVFDDFAAAAHYLIDAKITSTPKLAIDGGSNGGLLVGATLVQHPDLFGAAIAEQGVLDMLRYDKFTVGKAWIPEYGSASESADAFKWLYAYSPLHNVKPGTHYPPTLITTADHDDRVLPAHSFKFAAALQAAQGGDAPILLRVQTNEGHFSGLTTDEAIAIYSDFFAFLSQSLHFTPTL